MHEATQLIASSTISRPQARVIPALRASALSPEEEALRAKLEEAEEALRTGRVVGRMNELWALLGTLKAARGAAQTQWAVVDEDGLARLVQVRPSSVALNGSLYLMALV